MNRESLLQKFDRLNIWSQGDQRAPHKPLLVLYALARWQRGERDDIPFSAVERDLTPLLKEFGPSRRSYHPEYPFWRLQNDGVWAVRAEGEMTARTGHDDPRKSDLLRYDARAGFDARVQAALRADPSLVWEIAGRLLESHFPESLHQDILDAVGLTPGPTSGAKAKRDPQFRQKVLTAYEYRCAVCGLKVHLGSIIVALDAAHIRWHQAGGPDVESNGLALCVLHHKLFDLGAFTVESAGRVLVSDQVHGHRGYQRVLLRHHGKRVRRPQHPESHPDAAHLDWHAREVFKGKARHLDLEVT
jgi:putative restriction endonuclease